MIHAKIRELGQLEANWDGEGGRAIDPAVLLRADRLASVLEAHDTRLSHIGPCSDGSVDLEWFNPDLLISIAPDGTASIWWEGEE